MDQPLNGQTDTNIRIHRQKDKRLRDRPTDANGSSLKSAQSVDHVFAEPPLRRRSSMFIFLLLHLLLSLSAAADFASVAQLGSELPF